MKKLILITLVFLGITIYAQDEMTTVWESKLEHKMLFTGTGLEGEVSYAASDKSITAFNNDDGKVIWTKKFKEIAPGLKKIDELIPFWASKTIFLFDKKMGKDKIACIDLNTGDLLWETSKYQNVTEDNVVYLSEDNAFAISLKDKLVYIKARTGEEKWSTSTFKGVVGKYIWEDGFIVAVNFQPSGLAALFTGFKNQIAKINLSNGDIVWEQAYIGRAERKAVTREFLFDITLKEDMVILRMNGFQAYDYKTGEELWSAAFDFTPDKIVKAPQGSKRFGIYGAVAEPIIEGDEVFILDMSSKKSQYLKKYERKTGKLIWTSKEIKGAKAIPSIGKSGDKVILQIGGVVEAQAYIVNKSPEGTTTTEKIWYPDVKPWGLMAINTSDGSVAWRSEKFKKGISNSFTIDENVIVSSGKSLYSLKSSDGKNNYEISLKDDGIGLGVKIMPFNDQIIVIGGKGVSSHNINDGKLTNSSKYRASSLEAIEGDYLILKTDKADIASFDLNTCKYKQFKAKKGAVTALSGDGKFVYVYEKKDVTKLSTE